MTITAFIIKEVDCLLPFIPAEQKFLQIIALITVFNQMNKETHSLANYTFISALLALTKISVFKGRGAKTCHNMKLYSTPSQEDI